jgi:hypothetical protein
MTAGLYNITIEKGATFSRELTWKDENGDAIDLTGYTARMHIRTHPSASTAILELTTENSRISLGGAAGTVTLTVTPAVTTAITAMDGFYDLELVSSGGLVTRLLEGKVTFSPEVTQ